MPARFVHFWRSFQYRDDLPASRFLFEPLAKAPLRIGSVFGRSQEPFDLLYSGECVRSLRRSGDRFVWNEPRSSGSARWFVGTPKIDHERALWQPHFYYKWATYRAEPAFRDLGSQPKTFGVAVVISNLRQGGLAKLRASLAHQLSRFVPVHANAKLRKCALPDSRVVYHDVPKGLEAKLRFLGQFSHCLCFENESFPGYLTEKPFDSLFVGSVPLYRGDPSIGEWFEERSYVDCSGLSAQEIADAVQESNLYAEEIRERRETLCRVPFEEMERRMSDFYRRVLESSESACPS